MNIILKIDRIGSEIYFSLENVNLLKTVYRNITNLNVQKMVLNMEHPKYVYTSYQTNRKYFIGPEAKKIDFLDYVLSYKINSESKIIMIINLKPTIGSMFSNYSGLMFKMKIYILFYDAPDYDFISLVSNYWSNSKSSLHFSMRRGTFYSLINDENVNLLLPYPSKALENAGISSRFGPKSFQMDMFKKLIIGKGLYSNKFNFIRIFDKDGQSTFILGETGSGKSTLMQSLFFQLLNEEKPMILIDPTGDTAKEVISRLDKKYLKRVIYIDPVETPISMNILDIPEGNNRNLSISRVAEDIIQVLRNVTEAESGIVGGLVGSKIEEIIRNCVTGLVNIKGSNLLDISFIITRESVRKRLIKITTDPEFKNFLEDLDKFSNDDISSTRRTLSFLKTNPVLRTMICNRRPLFRISDAIEKNMIVIVNGERGKVGEKVSTFILSSIISMVWISLQERNNKKQIFLFCDEFQDYINSSFEDMLILGRKENLNLFMASTHLSTIPENVRESVMANVKNFILFKLSPSDARDFSEKFTVNKNDFMNLVPGTAFVKTYDNSEFNMIIKNIPDKSSITDMIIEKSKSYVSEGIEISPVLDIHDEAMSLFLDILFLKYNKISSNISNIISLREKIPAELKSIYDDEPKFLKDIIEKLIGERIANINGTEIEVMNMFEILAKDEIDKKIIEKLISLGLILRYEKRDYLSFICIPYSSESFNPLNKKYFRITVDGDGDLNINKNINKNCEHCISLDEFLNIKLENDLLEIILRVCLSSTNDDILITTSHRIAEAIRQKDPKISIKYGNDLERLIKKTLVENNYATDGERIILDNTRIRTLVINLKDARIKYQPFNERFDLKIK